MNLQVPLNVETESLHWINNYSASPEGLCSMEHGKATAVSCTQIYKVCPSESGTDKFMQRFI